MTFTQHATWITTIRWNAVLEENLHSHHQTKAPLRSPPTRSPASAWALGPSGCKAASGSRCCVGRMSGGTACIRHRWDCWHQLPKQWACAPVPGSACPRPNEATSGRCTAPEREKNHGQFSLQAFKRVIYVAGTYYEKKNWCRNGKWRTFAFTSAPSWTRLSTIER